MVLAVFDRRDSEVAHDLCHGFFENRSRDLPAIVRTRRRIQDNETDGPRILRRAEAAEGGDVLVLEITAVLCIDLLRSACLACHMIARYLGIAAAALGDLLLHHVLHFSGDRFRDRLPDHFLFRDLIVTAVGIFDRSDDMGLHHLSAIGKGAVGLHHLKRRDCDALPDGHGRNVNGPHVFRFKEKSHAFSRELDTRRPSESESLRIVGHRLTTGQKTDMCKARIDRPLDDIDKTHVTVRFFIPVLDGMTGCPDHTRVMPDALRIVGPGRECRRRDDRLEGRPRFINIDNGTVLELPLIRFFEMIRIIGRLISQCQDLSCLRIHDDDDAARRMGRLHCTVKRTLRIKLNVLINGQVHRAFLLRLEWSKY